MTTVLDEKKIGRALVPQDAHTSGSYSGALDHAVCHYYMLPEFFVVLTGAVEHRCDSVINLQSPRAPYCLRFSIIACFTCDLRL